MKQTLETHHVLEIFVTGNPGKQISVITIGTIQISETKNKIDFGKDFFYSREIHKVYILRFGKKRIADLKLSLSPYCFPGGGMGIVWDYSVCFMRFLLSKCLRVKHS